jgi:hypothetical protein
MPHDRLILLMGSQSQWTETAHGQAGQHDCPVCLDRDLAKERALGLNRICLRCLTGTWDPKVRRAPSSRQPSARTSSAPPHVAFSTRRHRRAAVHSI